MSEELVIRCCAPTLASLKTGSMFSCPFPSRQDMLCSVRCLNRRLRGKGLRMLPLRYRDGTGLIYLYRPKQLQQDLDHATAHRLLTDRGYACQNPCKCVKQLQERLAQQSDFPHEIGLFLGYPPEDVDGFIHRKHECKYTGRWKVYGDVDAARRTFAKYKKCTDVYLQQWEQGSQLERLAVNK